MKKAMLLWAAFLACWALAAIPSHAQVTLKVGAYHFPPFYHAKRGQGVTVDLIRFLNDNQDAYQFDLVPTSPRRRYADMLQGRFQIMMFEMPEWGWHNLSVETTPLLLTGGEVYVARAARGRDERFFSDVASRKLIGIAGYHYGFADFNSDADFLKSKFDIHLTPTHEGNLMSVIAGRREIAIVTQSFLRRWQKANPSKYDKLLVSEKLDQKYRLPLLVGSASDASTSDLWHLLTEINSGGALTKFFEQLGLRDQVAF